MKIKYNHVYMTFFMKQIQIFLVLFFFFFTDSLQSQETVMYRLHLKNKGNPPFSITNPDEFLSAKSIERRNRQGLTVDHFDLPLDPTYFEAISETGATIRTHSKWVKTVVVHLTDMDILPKLESLPFVDTLYCVWRGELPISLRTYLNNPLEPDTQQNTINSYGAGFTQIALNNGHFLHEAGFRGKGVEIAVLDAGFINVNIIEYFNQERIKEIKNFTHEVSDILRESNDHGTRVLSCMLSDKSGELVGTAPEADYYLFRTEVVKDEFPVEEDYWIAALEYADSLGVNIVTSSLGYTTFDDESMSHSQEQLDGQTAPISIAANLAASRGMLLFNSAGNEGNNRWRKISFPADAEHVITVGSINRDSTRSSFSSLGYSADNRIKPDLMAMGSGVSAIDNSGIIRNSNGTSFSTPIIAGLAACLWEALPDLNSFEMLDLLRESGNKFHDPDSLMGYGIADVYKAYLSKQTAVGQIPVFSDPVYVSINPFDNRLYINMTNQEQYSRCALDIYTALGNRVLSTKNLSGSIDVSSLPKGIYIVYLRSDNTQWVRKLVKR